jgi:hypothetical protein
MADISDVMDAISTIVSAACYPNGTSNPSISGNTITIGQGWPLPTDLDTAFKSVPPQSFISIFPMAGASSVEQVTADPVVIVAPVHGMSASVDTTGQIVTVTGVPNVGEYLTLVVSHTRSYSYAAVQGDTLGSVCSQVATLAAIDYPGTLAVGGVITVSAPLVAVRIGAPGTMGEIIHRQKHQIMVSVWAPNPTDRTTISAVVDVALKNNLRIALPDTSAAILTFNTTNFIDDGENAGEYRRDMTYLADFLTINQYTAYEVTSFTVERTDVPSPNVVL